MIIVKSGVKHHDSKGLPFENLPDGFTFRSTPYSKTFIKIKKPISTIKVDGETVSFTTGCNVVCLETGEEYRFDKNRIVFIVSGKFVEDTDASI